MVQRRIADERIAACNALAAELVTAQNIAIVYLNAAVQGHPECHSDNFQSSRADVERMSF
jgi:hypothetical protein